MSELWTLVDSAVAEVLSAHPDYLTPKGEDRARRDIVRKVTGALRDSITTPKVKSETEAAQTKPTTHAEIKCWSKEWWAILLHRIDARKSTSWIMQYALEAKHGASFAVPIDEAPAANVVETFQGYPSDGYVFANWRPWFESHNVRLPEWRERMWVFLPSVTPPSTADPPNEKEFADFN